MKMIKKILNKCKIFKQNIFMKMIKKIHNRCRFQKNKLMKLIKKIHNNCKAFWKNKLMSNNNKIVKFKAMKMEIKKSLKILFKI